VPQDSWDHNQVETVNELMRFSVWTGLEAHRPLGNINRSRRRTYKHSAEYREAFNKCPIHETQGLANDRVSQPQTQVRDA
jgi:hypothetical protein